MNWPWKKSADKASRPGRGSAAETGRADKVSPSGAAGTEGSGKNPAAEEAPSAAVRKRSFREMMKHRSIMRYILRIFLFSLIVVTIVATIVAYTYQSDRIGVDTRDRAISGISLARESLRGVDLSSPISPGVYASSRMMLRNICQNFNMKYLYVCQKGKEKDTVVYLYVVAAKDTDDALVRTTRSYGTVVSAKMSEAEEAALAGNEDPQYWRTKNFFGDVISWSMPLYNITTGQVDAIITADFLTISYLNNVLRAVLSTVALTALILLLSFILEFFLIRNRIFKPLSKLSHQMSVFASGKDLNTEPLNITSGDEIQDIADSFEKMTADIRSYVENLERVTSERAQSQAQLDVARNIQYGMVPASLHRKEKTVELSASMRPAREIGGDFYDCFFRPDGKLCVLMADVSGKGITAALFMAMAKSTLHEALTLSQSPAAALNHANDELCAQNPEGMFVTVFAMFLDVHTGEVTLANGGHNPPVIFSQEGSRIFEPLPGIALALFEDAGIEDENIRLAPGEGILLYTDGITEAVSTTEEFYGLPRLEELLKEPRPSTTNVLEDVMASVDGFAGGRDQFDDMTLAAVRYLGDSDNSPAAGLPSGKKGERIMGNTENDRSGSANDMTFKDAGTLDVTLPAFDILKEKILAVAGTGEKPDQILLAAEEAFVNIVSYSGASFISYELSKSGGRLTLVLIDDGVPFDPFIERPVKDFDEFDTGGMGILLIRQIVETASWNRKGEKNVLTLVFAL